MEYTLPELLTRDEIICILNNRCLHIDDIENKTLSDLQGIYKCFAMPRARRGSNRRALNGITYVTPAAALDNVGTMAKVKRSAAMETDEVEEKRIKLVYLNMNEEAPLIEPCEKRQLADPELVDTHLSSMAKRIRSDNI